LNFLNINHKKEKIIMENKFKLKKLLATASALAVITGASSASATLFTDNNVGLVVLEDGQNVINAVSVPGGTAGLLANDSYFFTNGQDLSLGAGNGAATMATIDLNNVAGRNITIANDSSIASVVSSGGVQTTALRVNSLKTLTLGGINGVKADGNTVQVAGAYDALGDITLGTAGGAGTGTLTIDSNATLGGAIDSDTAAGGVINVNANKTVTFSNVIGGGVGVAAINLLGDASNVTFSKDVTAIAINLKHANAVMNVADNRTVDGKILTTAVTGGILNADGRIQVTGLVGGVGNALNEVNINGTTGVGAAVFDDDVVTASMNVKHALAKVALDGDLTVTNGLNFSTDGQVTLATTQTITGNVKNTVTGVVTNGVTTYADNGKLVLASGIATTVTGNIGEVGKRLNLVSVTGGVAPVVLSNANGSHHAKEFKFDNNAGRLKVAAGGVLNGNIVANAAGNGGVLFDAAGGINGQIGAAGAAVALIEATTAEVTISAGDHVATALDVKANTSSFKMKDGANLTGGFTRTAGAAGTTAVTFEGSSTVTGGLANGVTDLNINGAADKVVSFGANVIATNANIGAGTLKVGADLTTTDIKFTDAKSGKLIVDGAGAHAIVGQAAQDATKISHGEIIVTNTVGANAVTFGKLGDAATVAALGLLDIQNTTAGGSVVVAGGSHITNIKAAGDSTLKLLAGDHKIVGIELAQSDKLNLEFGGALKIKNPTAGGQLSLGTEAKKLKTISFTGNTVTTIEDGVSIVATAINTGAVGRGTLTFEGDSTFDANNTGNSLAAINVNGNAKTVKLLKNTEAAAVVLATGSTLELGGNLSGTVNGKAANNEGTLRFVNSAASTLTGAIGGTKTLNAIEFNGNDVKFVGAVTHTGDFKFGSANPMKVTFDAATGITANNFVNNSPAGTHHTVVLGKAQAFATGSAANTASRINFQVDAGGIDASIAGAGNYAGASITTGTNNQGTFTFNHAAGSTIYSAGADGSTLADVIFTENGTITNGTFAEAVTVALGKTANLGGEVKVVPDAGIDLANAGSTVNFLDGVKLNSKVIAATADKGDVIFAGGGSVEAGKHLGAAAKLNSVTFSDTAGKVLALNATNIAANTVSFRKGTVKAVGDVAINSTVITATDASFDLGSKNITVATGNTLTFNGANKIAVAVAQSGNVITAGKIVIAASGNVKFTPTTALAITPDDSNGTRPTGGSSREFTLIDNQGNAILAADQLNLANVTIDQTKNPFTRWTKKVGANNSLVLVQTDGAEEEITKILGSKLDSVDASNIKALTAAEAGTDGSKFINLLSTLVGTPDKIDEAIDRLTSVTTATDAIEGTMGNITNQLGARLGQTGNQKAGVPVQSRAVASASVSGVNAGDDHARFGAWFSPFFSKTTQKARKGAAGYKDTSYGGSVGVDTRANDDLIIGGAFTFANSEMKHRDFKAGDKTKVDSVMFSIYAMQQITDSWFAQGTATIGSNNVRNTENKVASATTFDAVQSKYSSMSFNGEALFGYNYANENFSLTPLSGLRYSRVNSSGYKESGSTTGQNLDVSQKSSDKLEVILGARVSGGTFDVNGMAVTPELHGFINHDIIGKNPKQSLRIGGVASPLAAKSRKPVKTTYNLGLGVNAEYGMMEYGAGYDLNLAEKRVGHEGTLKVRVNF
jgi:outer membrane autotransporter protein